MTINRRVFGGLGLGALVAAYVGVRNLPERRWRPVRIVKRRAERCPCGVHAECPDIWCCTAHEAIAERTRLMRTTGVTCEERRRWRASYERRERQRELLQLIFGATPEEQARRAAVFRGGA